MADHADVRSLEHLEGYLQRLETFRTKLMSEIENLVLELRRLTNWLEDDVYTYWTNETVTAQRHWSECRDVLSRCMSYVREDEKRSCTEEKKRLGKAEERLELCRQKMKITKAAISFWEAERNKQHARVERTRDLADADMLVASHQLREQLEQLRRYTALRTAAFSAPARSPSTGELSGDDSLSLRPGAETSAAPQEPRA